MDKLASLTARFRYWLRDLRELLVIFAAGALVALITWLATIPSPPGCHEVPPPGGYRQQSMQVCQP